MADNKVSSLNILTLYCRGYSVNIERFRGTLCITVQNESIYGAPFVKSLGFFTDENADWGDHVRNVLKNVSSGE